MSTKRGRLSFTLIELLVVVAVILILFSIGMKIMPLAKNKGEIAKTTWLVEQVKNALGAFYSEYGAYPPVSTLEYTRLSDNNADYPVRYPGVDFANKTGLVYYLAASPRFFTTKNKWEHEFKNGEVWTDGDDTQAGSFQDEYKQWRFYTNKTAKLASDAWGHAIHYSCSNADSYLGYRLWSDGPNGSNEFGGGDDIGFSMGQ